MGGVGEVGGVGAAGVGDHDAAEIAEGGLEEGGFGGEIHLGEMVLGVGGFVCE